MQILSLLVGAVAVACLAAAAFLDAAKATGFFSDLSLLGVAIAGLGIAFATWRAPAISAFLRVFSWIFGVEFIATALGYLAVRAGVWPAFLSGAPIPVSMPVTIAVFGILIYLISFIPVVNQITRLADPYFESNEPKTFSLGPLGTYTVAERQFGAWLVAILIVINQAQVGINVRLSFFGRDWFNAIQKKDSVAFWNLLLTVFLCVGIHLHHQRAGRVFHSVSDADQLASLAHRKIYSALAQRWRHLPDGSHRRRRRQPRPAYLGRHQEFC